jgi:hypothetical protein
MPSGLKLADRTAPACPLSVTCSGAVLAALLGPLLRVRLGLLGPRQGLLRLRDLVEGALLGRLGPPLLGGLLLGPPRRLDGEV